MFKLFSKAYGFQRQRLGRSSQRTKFLELKERRKGSENSPVDYFHVGKPSSGVSPAHNF